MPRHHEWGAWQELILTNRHQRCKSRGDGGPLSSLGRGGPGCPLSRA